MAKRNEIQPPRWATFILRKFADRSSLEEVEGDLGELFPIWVSNHGLTKANRKYVLTVMTLLRPFRNEKKSNHSSANFMIGSYFKMSWRTLRSNKVSSLINISGLTIGLAISILIMLVVKRELGMDKFHSNLPEIYLLMTHQKTNDGIFTGRATPGPAAEALRTGFPEVTHAARVAEFDGKQILVNNTTTYESGIYVDPDFFRIMTFPSVLGDAASALETGNSVVITRDMAEKLFTDKNPIGKVIVFNKRHSLVVGAVLADIPHNSSIHFGMVIPFALFEKENDWLRKWDDNRIRTWLQLDPSVNLTSFKDKATALLQKNINDKGESMFAYPFEEIYLRGDFSNGHPNGGRITFISMLIGFGIFMLAIACINFMNIATAQSEHRAREVGLRKVLGASRRWIAFQFLSESFLITFFSLGMAVVVTYAAIPWFNTLTRSGINFELLNSGTWSLLLGIAFVTALMAGSYPSVFLSRFVPVRVLKASVVNIKGGGLRRTLVTFQFAISIFILISTIIMYSQFDYVRNRPIGYEQENLIDIQLDSLMGVRYSYLKDQILNMPNVKSVTGGSGNILYSGASITGMDWPGKKPGDELAIAFAEVQYDWSKTIGIRMVKGRDFDSRFKSDQLACMINESAVAKMGLENPIGSNVGGHPVIGVFQDFVFDNPSGTVSPMAVYLNENGPRHMYLRIQNNSAWRETIGRIEKLSKSISPGYPFHFSFTKDEYQRHFNEVADGSLMISIFGGMTIFISCLGLFGLSGYVAEKRSKEMSIRKVFGATIGRVLISLSGDFLRPVFFALVVVMPLTWWAAQTMLSHIVYHVSLSWWMFGSGGVAITLVAFTIVLYHGRRTAMESPIIRLRNE